MLPTVFSRIVVKFFTEDKFLQFPEVVDIGCVAEDSVDTYKSVVMISILLHVTEMRVMLYSI